MPVIAVDAMGGDRAPAAVVEGALLAARERHVAVVLVGPSQRLHDEIARHDRGDARVDIVDAPDVIGMDESPLTALRRKPGASIRVAAELVRSGQAAALFSAGHSGATMLAVHGAFGMLAGADRPALAVTVPTPSGEAVLLDAGANVECRPEHLVEFAHLGAAYAQVILDVSRPRVGLLSIGEEPGKGTDLIRLTHQRLLAAGASLNFIGNLEARDLFSGRADVIVCDGFTGNIALKVGEGLVEALEQMLREELGSALVSQIGALLMSRAFARLRQRVDSAEYGAAPLLGVQGLALIGHGRSSPRAIASGVALAVRLADAGLVTRLAGALAAAHA
ncbi:MAG: phosphate acyltransferase PlsX [Acidobacteriota bacterium]